jgi:Glycosyltransferase Family 4
MPLEPLNIGLLAPPWAAIPPPGYGGTESVVCQLARGLSAAGHEVTLYATGDSTAPVPIVYAMATADWDRIGHGEVVDHRGTCPRDGCQRQGAAEGIRKVWRAAAHDVPAARTPESGARRAG